MSDRKRIRILIGETPPAGTVVELFHGHGETRETIETMTADGRWECPPTAHGAWYGRRPGERE